MVWSADGCIVAIMIPPRGTLLFYVASVAGPGILVCVMPERKSFFIPICRIDENGRVRILDKKRPRKTGALVGEENLA